MYPKPITLLFIVLALVGIIVFTPSAFADTTVTMTKGASSGQACVAANNCFDPANAQVTVGETVTWTNADTASHTITSGNPDDNVTGTDFDSGLVKAGGTYHEVFTSAGTFNYYCQVHPWMIGQVIVGGSAPAPIPTITVSTDRTSYKDGDLITISGTVSNYIYGKPVSVIVRNPIGNVVAILQVDLGSDETYSTTITAGDGSLWQSAGTYEVDAQFISKDISAKTTFQFSGSNVAPSGNTIKVDGTDFAVTYSIANGKVFGIKADGQSKSLVVSIQTTGDGQLTIDLPRALIDAKTNEQTDDQFFVLNDGQKARFTETKITTDRTLTIPFTDGTGQIEIIGTLIVNGGSSIPAPIPPGGTGVIMSKGSSSGQACVTTQNCFSPSVLSRNAGQTVTWYNSDTASHTVTSGYPNDNVTGTIFDSSLIKAGGIFAFTFNNAGTFNYYCQVHPWMTGQIIVGSGTNPQPSPTITISSDRSSYNLNDLVNLSVNLSGVSSGQNVAVSVSDPSGTSIISRIITTDTIGSGTLQFKISNNAQSGTYQVISTASVNGQNIKSSTQFTVTAQSSVSIISVQPTDQQGNPVTSFSKGTNGFVKVVLSAQSSVPSLVTVNLSGADQTIIGLGSLKSTLGSGNSEITLSFFIPSNAASGTANIYADAFSDWPRNGGIPLTKESQVSVEIQ